MVAWDALMPAALHASAVVPTGLSSAEYIRLSRLHHRGALVTIPSTPATIPLTAASIPLTAATVLLTAATLWRHSSIPVTDAATVLESAAPHTPSPQPSRSPRQVDRPSCKPLTFCGHRPLRRRHPLSIDMQRSRRIRPATSSPRPHLPPCNHTFPERGQTRAQCRHRPGTIDQRDVRLCHRLLTSCTIVRATSTSLDGRSTATRLRTTVREGIVNVPSRTRRLARRIGMPDAFPTISRRQSGPRPKFSRTSSPARRPGRRPAPQWRVT
jgi:hypothetical protein